MMGRFAPAGDSRSGGGGGGGFGRQPHHVDGQPSVKRRHRATAHQPFVGGGHAAGTVRASPLAAVVTAGCSKDCASTCIPPITSIEGQGIEPIAVALKESVIIEQPKDLNLNEKTMSAENEGPPPLG